MTKRGHVTFIYILSKLVSILIQINCHISASTLDWFWDTKLPLF